jgi:hypothetical protein
MADSALLGLLPTLLAEFCGFRPSGENLSDVFLSDPPAII